MQQSAEPLLEVNDLQVVYRAGSAWRAKPEDDNVAVGGVSLRLARGEVLSLVGESGCGKTSTAWAIARLLEPTSGRITFDDKDITHTKPKHLSWYRSQAQVVFQDPLASLNPRMRIGALVAEPLRLNQDVSRSAAMQRVAEVLEEVGLNDSYVNRWPRELSGGQRQRVCIARALIVRPAMMICDEPVAALDVSVQATILSLLVQLQREHNLSLIFICHDLSLLPQLGGRIAVMSRGQIVEEGEVKQVLRQPQQPYTRTLMDAVPRIGGRRALEPAIDPVPGTH